MSHDCLAADLAPTGTLRAAINLGNPVLAQGTLDAPRGVTVEIAHELGRRLSLPVSLHPVDAARKSFEAMAAGAVDVCFLAIEPAREVEVRFTAPYVLVDGSYAVSTASTFRTPQDVDAVGVRIGVNRGSAYDLFLTRTLERASLVRADDGVAAYRSHGLEAVAGIRAPLAELAATDPGLRLVEPAFMRIRQALGVSLRKDPATAQFLASFIEELKANGFVQDALIRSGQDVATVAPAFPLE